MTRAPAGFPDGGKRLVIFTLFDRRGGVEDYVIHALTGLRPHAERIVVVVNGSLDDVARDRIEAIVDDVIVRPNTGLDIEAQRTALTSLGDDITLFDEVILTNDTWYGPIDSFAPLFARMDAEEVDAWAMTAHAPATPHPLTGDGSAPYHLQSYWIAARRSLVASDAWRDYWTRLGPIHTYRDAVLLHETRFTEHFRSLGFILRAAFDVDLFDTDNASLWMPQQLREAGCPVLKRRVLFHSPIELTRRAVVGRDVIARIVEDGYPAHVLWADLARNVQPKTLQTNAGLLEILPGEPSDDVPAQAPRIVVVAHIFYEDMTAQILDRADMLPGGYDLIVTTATAAKADAIRAVTDRRRPADRRTEIRVVASNDGRDQSAFLIGARDVLLDDAYDLVVKLHSKKTPQDGFNVGRLFAAHQFDNLLASPGHAAELVGLFVAEPQLGLVFPPTFHIGYPTLGQAWWANRPGVARLCAALDVHVPLDDGSPLAPFGSMFVARPAALRRLVEYPWRYTDFGGADQYRDGGLAHILERAPVYVAGEAGYFSRTVLTPDHASVSQAFLDFDLDQLTALVPTTAEGQFGALTRVGHFGDGRAVDFARIFVRTRFPGTGAALRRVLRPLLAVRRRLRGVDRPSAWEKRDRAD